MIWPSKTHRKIKKQCKIITLMQLLDSNWEGHRFLWFGASWSPMASWSPRCLPDASQMPPRCLPMPPRCLSDASQMPLRCLSDASQMPLRCFFSKWFLLYDSLFNDSSPRISSLSSLLQRVPLHDSSWLISLAWFFEWVYKETLFGVSRWGHFYFIGSRIGTRENSPKLVNLFANKCKCPKKVVFCTWV